MAAHKRVDRVMAAIPSFGSPNRFLIVTASSRTSGNVRRYFGENAAIIPTPRSLEESGMVRVRPMATCAHHHRNKGNLVGKGKVCQGELQFVLWLQSMIREPARSKALLNIFPGYLYYVVVLKMYQNDLSKQNQLEPLPGAQTAFPNLNLCN